MTALTRQFLLSTDLLPLRLTFRLRDADFEQILTLPSGTFEAVDRRFEIEQLAPAQLLRLLWLHVAHLDVLHGTGGASGLTAVPAAPVVTHVDPWGQLLGLPPVLRALKALDAALQREAAAS